MAVELEIRDGDPWWLSPDLWVVPGTNPEGPPGIPVVGEPAYLWARVRNNGTTSVVNAQVRFYWADPSTAFDRNTAHELGISNVSLDTGESSEVLLLVPWIPEFVNGGHECILAEAFHTSADPLPVSPAFDVPTDRHVAQRNLSVVVAAASGFFSFNFNAFNTSRLAQEFSLQLEPGRVADLKPLAKTLGKGWQIPEQTATPEHLGFIDALCAHEGDLERARGSKIDVEIQAHRKANWSIVGRLQGAPSLIHVVQRQGSRTVGGLSVLVLPPTEAPPRARSAQAQRRES